MSTEEFENFLSYNISVDTRLCSLNNKVQCFVLSFKLLSENIKNNKESWCEL